MSTSFIMMLEGNLAGTATSDASFTLSFDLSHEKDQWTFSSSEFEEDLID